MVETNIAKFLVSVIRLQSHSELKITSWNLFINSLVSEIRYDIPVTMAHEIVDYKHLVPKKMQLHY